ncbi:hypothetical protein HDU80_002919, partial [Chytriomyces hyalinus]
MSATSKDSEQPTQDTGNIDNPPQLSLMNTERFVANTERFVSGTDTQATATLSIRTDTQATGTLFSATAVGTQTGTAVASATVFTTDGPFFGGIATEVPKTGAIVGSLIGVIAVLGLVAGFLIYRRKYMNKNQPKTDSERAALEVSDPFLPSPATVQLESLASLEATLREYETLVSQKAAIVAAHERDLTSNVAPEKTSASSSLFAKFEPSNESDSSSSHRFALPADPINWTEDETAQWILEKYGNPTLSSLAL